MRQSTRKFIGTLLTLSLIVAYSLGAGEIYANFLAEAPWWALLAYFASAGLLWFFPAALIIRWMARPDKRDAS